MLIENIVGNKGKKDYRKPEQYRCGVKQGFLQYGKKIKKKKSPD
jgi:hypothetical protein